MSEPPRPHRPVTARPRTDPVGEEVPPPSSPELEGIESGLVRLVELAGAGRVDDPELHASLLTWPGRGPAFNHAARPRWSDLDLAASAGAVARRLRSIGESPCVVIADGLATPTDLGTRLLADGWLAAGGEQIMWTRRATVVPHLDLDLRLEAVTSTGIDEYEAIERTIFGISSSERDDRRATLGDSVGRGVIRAYLVRLGGQPVATGRLLVEGGLAVAHGLGVLPEHRRRGLGGYLTTIVTRAGLALGGSLVWLSVDPDNLAAVQLYSSLDYRPAFRWHRLLGIA